MNHPVDSNGPDAAATRGLALVIGAGGGVGAALLAQLERDGEYAQVLAVTGRGEQWRWCSTWRKIS